MNKYSLCRESMLLWQYGAFALICHAVAILFCATLSRELAPDLLFHRYFPMIEHTIIGFIAVLGGVVALEYIEKNKKD